MKSSIIHASKLRVSIMDLRIVMSSGAMSADNAGMKIEFKMDWEGKRIGDCP